MNIYSHNIDAYKKAKEVYATGDTKRTCVVQPMGTGKSYVGLQFVADAVNELGLGARVLYLTSNKIIQTQFENLMREYFKSENIAIAVPGVQISTNLYVGILNKQLQGYTHIILDEFHRVGAEKTDVAIRELLKACPDAYILGLSATPVRYLDDKRDMCEELFDGNVASEMTLAQAITGGILPVPKYVTCLYSLQDEYNKAVSKLGKIKVADDRQKAAQILDRAKSYLENSQGLPEVFTEHIADVAGKFIVFCRDIEHMHAMIDEAKAKSWFADVNREVHYYAIHSAMTKTELEQVQKDFERDNSQALKLLFCVDMCNEGYHPEGLSGVILLRPTTSVNVYMQQIGRGLSAVKAGVFTDKSPLIVDVVHNIGCLHHVEHLRDEVNQIFGEASDFDKEFRIYACAKDFTACLEEFDKYISYDWYTCYNLAVDYMKTSGADCITKRTGIYKGVNIGQWFVHQRKRMRKGGLTQDKTVLLQELIALFTDNMAKWMAVFEQVKQVYAEKGHLPEPFAVGSKLHKWVSQHRKCYTSGILSQTKIDILNSINFVWDYKTAFFNYKLDVLEAYIKETGDCYAQSEIHVKGVNINSFGRGLRQAYEENRLQPAIKQRLDDVGFSWVQSRQDNWMKNYEALKQYIQMHGSIEGVGGEIRLYSITLHGFIQGQRNLYKKGSLQEDRLKLLQDIGICLEDDSKLLFKNHFASVEDKGTFYIDVCKQLQSLTALTEMEKKQLKRCRRVLKKLYLTGELTDWHVAQMKQLGLLDETGEFISNRVIYHSTDERCLAYIDKYIDLQRASNATKKVASVSVYKSFLKKLYLTGELSDYSIMQLRQLGLIDEQGEFVSDKVRYASADEKCANWLMQYLKLQGVLVPTEKDKQRSIKLKSDLKKLYNSNKLSDFYVAQLKQLGLVNEVGVFVGCSRKTKAKDE